jgi:hypothetical protein
VSRPPMTAVLDQVFMGPPPSASLQRGMTAGEMAQIQNWGRLSRDAARGGLRIL